MCFPELFTIYVFTYVFKSLRVLIETDVGFYFYWDSIIFNFNLKYYFNLLC